MLLFSTKKQNETNVKTLNQSDLRKSESGPKSTQGKYMTNHADSEDILTNQEKKKKRKCDRIHISRTNHTPQRHYKKRNLYQDQSILELFWKKKTQGNTPR